MDQWKRVREARGVFRRTGPDGASHYQVIVYFGGDRRSFTEGQHPAFTFKKPANLEQAVRFQLKMEAEAKAGKLVPASPLTVGEVFAARIKDLTVTGNSANTIAAYKATLGSLERHKLAVVKLNKVTVKDVETYRSALQKINAPKTVKDRLVLLGAALTWAVKQGWLPKGHAVVGTVTKPKVNAPRRPVLTVDQANRLLDALLEIDSPFERFLAVALLIPVRVESEMRALLWRDVNLEAGTYDLLRLYIQGEVVPAPETSDGKGFERAVDIPPRALPIFESQRTWQLHRDPDQRWDDTEGLVWTDHRGRMLALDALRRRLSAACAVAGVPRLTIHGLRHVNATLHVHLGGDLKTLMTRLGHSRVETTMRYVGLVPGSTAAWSNMVADAISNGIGDPGELRRRATERARAKNRAQTQ